MCGGNNTITDFATGVVSDGLSLSRQHLESIEAQCQWMVCIPCIAHGLELLLDDLLRRAAAAWPGARVRFPGTAPCGSEWKPAPGANHVLCTRNHYKNAHAHTHARTRWPRALMPAQCADQRQPAGAASASTDRSPPPTTHHHHPYPCRGVASLLASSRACAAIARLLAAHPTLGDHLHGFQLSMHGRTWELALPPEGPPGCGCSSGLVALMAGIHRWAGASGCGRDA
jgi:hypothetical protein